MELFYEFVDGVKDGSILSCEKVKLAVQRHENDLEKSKSDDFPYYFDQDLANRSLIILGLLRHTAGDYAGELFRITPIQAFITCSIFGWVKKSDQNRRFLKSYLEVPRKWGKSEYLAALSIIFGLFDGEEGAQMIVAATKLPQCRYVFEPIKKMLRSLIKDEPDLASEIKINDREVKYLDTGNKFFMLSAQAAKEDGANPHFAAVDELHAHPNIDLLKVIETGTLARSQSLVFIITTAGFNSYGICKDQRDTVTNILKEVAENERYFGLICELDEDDNWEDPSNWPKANPHIGVTIPLENMIAAYVNAITEGPESVREFKVKNLNMWEDSADPWVTTKAWNNCGNKSISLANFWGKVCSVGMDLSSDSDLTAVCVAFPSQDDIENPHYFFRIYCPSTKIQTYKRKDGVDYRKWTQQGHIKMTPGNTIDFGYIKNDILKIAEQHKLIIAEYDPYNSDAIIPVLEGEGINCNPHRQGPPSMNTPVRRMYRLIQNHPDNQEELDPELEPYIVEKQEAEVWDTQEYMVHDGNPAVAWMIGNIETMQDSNGNIKFAKNSVKGAGKKKSANKIDAAVAAAMATTGWMFPPESNESAYNTNDLLVI